MRVLIQKSKAIVSIAWRGQACCELGHEALVRFGSLALMCTEIGPPE
jgi:hypothetical protein